MLDSSLEPLYNLSKNLLLLNLILKLIGYMVNDSTPLFKGLSSNFFSVNQAKGGPVYRFHGEKNRALIAHCAPKFL